MAEPALDPVERDAPRERKLADLRVGLWPVIVSGRVVHAERRSVRGPAEGATRPVVVGWLADDSATVRFTWWDPPEEELAPGDGLRAGPVGIREYRGRIELSFGRKTRVEPLSPLEMPVEDPEARALRWLGDLRAGEEDLRLEATVVRLDARTRMGRDGERRYFLGEILDGSGRCPFVAWIDLGLREGTRYRFTGPYVRSFRNSVEVVLDERTRAEPLEGPSPGPTEATGARIRYTPAPVPSSDPPLPADSARLAERVRELSERSPDGYASREAVRAWATTALGLDPRATDAAIQQLVRRGYLSEPLAGLFRAGTPAVR